MQQETELFFAEQLRGDHPLVEMLQANYTFVNQRLAEHYGIPKVYGSTISVVSHILMIGVRGILGQAVDADPHHAVRDDGRPTGVELVRDHGADGDAIGRNRLDHHERSGWQSGHRSVRSCRRRASHAGHEHREGEQHEHPGDDEPGENLARPSEDAVLLCSKRDIGVVTIGPA